MEYCQCKSKKLLFIWRAGPPVYWVCTEESSLEGLWGTICGPTSAMRKASTLPT